MRIGVFLVVALCAGCARDSDPSFGETWPEAVQLQRIEPRVLLPQTQLKVLGAGFVTQILGTTRLRLEGNTTDITGTTQAVDASLLVSIDSYEVGTVSLNRPLFTRICGRGDGVFRGTATLEIASTQSNRVYRPDRMAVELRCTNRLQPTLSSVQGGLLAINSQFSVNASNLLLGGIEGTSELQVDGCLLPVGFSEPCDQNGIPIVDQRVPLEVVRRDSRQDATSVLSADLVGIQPGILSARVRVVNIGSDGQVTQSGPQFWDVDIDSSMIALVESEGASLGGYLDFQGRGFIGGTSDEVMEVAIDGIFEADNDRPDRAVRVSLFTEFVAGDLVRYVVNEDDELGGLVDLRKESGTFFGEFRARLAKGGDSLTLNSFTSSFRIQPIRQVVHVVFTQGFTDALERFGLRNLERQIKTSMIDRAQQIFGGIAVDFRETPPDDYRLYSTVEITGTDPNGIGLIGYDNTPGKDDGNQRLYDQIGGVHAQTQEDGFPGYGGVFLNSFFSFSMAPPAGVQPNPGASPLFDATFDPFRPDRGGRPASADEAQTVFAPLSNPGCPVSSGRDRQLQCAVFVMGNLIGGTMAHEIAHSVGLADPGGEQFHNPQDRPNHLMDSGFDRPFAERGALEGQGPEFFCAENYQYLRDILPTGLPDPNPARTSCYD